MQIDWIFKLVNTNLVEMTFKLNIFSNQKDPIEWDVFPGIFSLSLILVGDS